MGKRTTVSDAILMCDDPEQPGAGEVRPSPKIVVMPPRPPRAPPGNLKPCPEPGVYPGVPFAEYASWDALNHSRLREIEDCPELFKHAEDHPEDEVETAPKGFGIAAHQAVFEPELFRMSATLGPVNPETGECYGRTTQKWAAAVKANPGKTLIGRDEMEMIAGICDRLNADEHIRLLLNHPKALKEVVIVWDEETTGDRCKRRIDLAVAEFGWLDLKSTESANPDDFDGAITNYFYHTADAFTERGVQTLKKLCRPALEKFGLQDWLEHSVLLAARKKPPYTAALYTVGPKTMQIARNLVTGWLHKIRECRAAGHFPAYGTGVMELEGREYYLRQFGMSREA